MSAGGVFNFNSMEYAGRQLPPFMMPERDAVDMDGRNESEHKQRHGGGRPQLRPESGVNGFDAAATDGAGWVHVDEADGRLMGQSAISMHLPDGTYVTPVGDRFEVDEQTKLQYGRHQKGSPESRAAIQGSCTRGYDVFICTGYQDAGVLPTAW